MKDQIQLPPSAISLEKIILGTMLLFSDRLAEIFTGLTVNDFSLEQHRTIYRVIKELWENGATVDRITVTEKLINLRQLESVGGLGYLTTLDDGLPEIFDLDSYIKILQEKALLRDTMTACHQFAERCAMAGENSAEILEEAQEMLTRLSTARANHGNWKTAKDVILEYPGGLNEFLQPSRTEGGMPFPWPGLTTATCGLQEGELMIVAGRPSMGKSIVAMQIAHHAASLGEPAAVFSLEMSKESLFRRLVAAVGRVDFQAIRTGTLGREERRKAAAAAASIAELPLWIDDTHAHTIAAQHAALRKLATKPKLIVVDYLQLMSASGRTENRHHELSQITQSLKRMAREMKARVILVSQLNRQCEIRNERPQLSDLRETGSIEEHADLVMFVHRFERYQKYRDEPKYKGKGEFILAKQRNGPIGTLHMLFFGKWQRFDEAAAEGMAEPEE